MCYLYNMKKLYAFLLVLTFTTVMAGCSKDEPLPKVTDFQKAILGKWRMTYSGNRSQMYPIKKSSEYLEYMPDSILRIYQPETNEFFYAKYWIKDSLLFQEPAIYKLNFTNYNNHQLDLTNMTAINYTSFYKRIE